MIIGQNIIGYLKNIRKTRISWQHSDVWLLDIDTTGTYGSVASQLHFRQAIRKMKCASLALITRRNQSCECKLHTPRIPRNVFPRFALPRPASRLALLASLYLSRSRDIGARNFKLRLNYRKPSCEKLWDYIYREKGVIGRLCKLEETWLTPSNIMEMYSRYVR